MHKADMIMEGKAYFENLPAETRDTFQKLAEKYNSGKVRYKKLLKDLRDSVDFKNMSVEDAVMLMFMLLAEDARKDLKELLDDMESTRLKRQALRLEQELLKKEISCLKKKFRKQSKRKKKAASHFNSIEKAVRDYKRSKLDGEKPFLAYNFKEE